MCVGIYIYIWEFYSAWTMSSVKISLVRLIQLHCTYDYFLFLFSFSDRPWQICFKEEDHRSLFSFSMFAKKMIL